MGIKKSAGILLYRPLALKLQVLLVLPGGPFWKNKDLGSWTIPKGEFSDDETPLVAAQREFEEELGTRVHGAFHALNPIQQKGGKWVFAFALENDFDTSTFRSNSFSLEWPPKSGNKTAFPEIAKAQWFGVDEAKAKINPAQLALLNELESVINTR